MAHRRLAAFWSIAILAPVVAALASACGSDQHEEKLGRQSQALGEDSGPLTKQITASADSYLKEGTPNQNQGTLTALRLQASNLTFHSSMGEFNDWKLKKNLLKNDWQSWRTVAQRMRICCPKLNLRSPF